ncbi:MAG: hypothetical protein MHM6MM_008258 [Cercozoa sp. M6MM]
MQRFARRSYSMTKLTLFAKGTSDGKLGDCPFSHKINMQLKHQGLEHEVVCVDLDNKPDWWLQMGQDGKAPTTPLLKIGENTLVRSSDEISRRLLVEPDDCEDIMQKSSALFGKFVRFLKKKDNDSAERAEFEQGLLDLNALVQGDFMCGSEPGRADFDLCPKLLHAQTMLKHTNKTNVLEWMQEHTPALHAVYQNVCALPCWEATLYPEETICVTQVPNTPGVSHLLHYHSCVQRMAGPSLRERAETAAQKCVCKAVAPFRIEQAEMPLFSAQWFSERHHTVVLAGGGGVPGRAVPSGMLLCRVSAEGALVVFARVDTHDHLVRTVVPLPGNEFLAAVGMFVRLFRFTGQPDAGDVSGVEDLGAFRADWSEKQPGVSLLRMHADTNTLLTVGFDRRMRVWDYNRVVFSQDVSSLLSETDEDKPDTRFLGYEKPLPSGRASSRKLGAAFSNDGRLLATVDCTNVVKVWQCAAQKLLIQLRFDDPVSTKTTVRVTSCCFASLSWSAAGMQLLATVVCEPSQR